MSNGGTKVLVRQEQIDVQDLADSSILALITEGDCSRLSVPQKLAYYKARCDIGGLDYRTAPMQFIKLQGKEILYTLKSGTDQLAKKHGIKLHILDRRTEDGVYEVTVRAICADGRETDDVGDVCIAKLQGEALSNARMKAVTKAKRRAILSVTGMGTPDESEIDSIPGAVKPTSDLPWAERASAQKTEVVGTPDRALEAALVASLAPAEEGASPLTSPAAVLVDAATASLPRSEGTGSSDGDASSLLMDDLGQEFIGVNEFTGEPILINERDRRYFHVCREQGHHPKDSAKEWLRAMYGYSSTSEIHKDQLEDICARLRDPMPL